VAPGTLFADVEWTRSTAGKRQELLVPGV